MFSPCRAFVTLLSALAAFAASPPARLSARMAPQQSVASERPAGLTVDFIAVDSVGAPIADLQPSEIEVRIGDRPRIVRALRRVTAASAPAASSVSARVPPPYGTNAAVETGRRFLLVVDQESFGAGREQLFRDAVEGLLTGMTAADQVMVAALPFGGVRVPFTSDVQRIRLALGRVAGQGLRAETGSDLACRTRRFLESLQGLLAEQGSRGAPVTLVLFTAGMAGPRRDAPMGVAPGMCELLVDQFNHVATAASAARANVYLMQPADITMGASVSRQTSIGGVGDLGSDNPLEGIEHLVGVTGGLTLPLDAVGTGSLRRVIKESAAYYVAEIEPVRGEPLTRSRSLGVKVARRGVTVRTRPEIAFVEPAPAAKTRLAVSELLASPGSFTDLPLRIGGFTVRDGDGRLRVGVVVESVDPAATLGSVGAVLIDGDGRGVARWIAKDATERPLLGAMPAAPGSYRLRVAALDSSGRAGVAETPIDAGVTTVGPLTLGSLLVGVSRNGATAPQLEFGPEPTAIAFFDIYSGSAAPRLAATLEVARDLDGPPLATLPLALTRADDARVVATGTVPVGALAPGDYVIRGVIRLEDGTIGRVFRTLRKVAR